MQLADDADIVLAKCRELRAHQKLKAEESKAALALIDAAGTDPDPDPDVDPDPDPDPDADADANADANIDVDPDAVNSSNAKATGSTSLGGKSIIEVSEMSSTEVVESIEAVAVQIAKQVLQKKGFSLDIPTRSAANQVYVPELDRIVLGEKRGTRSFLNVKVSRVESSLYNHP